ncbi:terminase large subunit domain-containing protein [Halomonas litopenaei]|uniref:terminase large subunit domain-containing protein n=1 Tax=Halomonas litopenaei TaxID=2109328 RepID=UPI003F9FF7F8
MANNKKERPYSLAIDQDTLSDIPCIAPLSDKQESFVNCKSNFVFYGGGQNAAKTYYSIMNLLVGAVDDEYFTATVIRDSLRKVKQSGGLWDMSKKLFPKFSATSNGIEYTFKFPIGSSIKYGHLQAGKAEELHQGSNNTMIVVDEICDPDITEDDILYLLNRLRGSSRQAKQMKATGNPSYHSFMRVWLEKAGYVDPETGFEIPEKNGKEVFFSVVNGEVVFADTKKEMKERFGEIAAKNAMTFTAIHARIYDNPFALKYDQMAVTTMENFKPDERDRLLHGCWKSTDHKGYIKKEMFHLIDRSDVPLTGNLVEVRAWDFAASRIGENGEMSPDATVGIKGKYNPDTGDIYITDMVRMFESFAVVEEVMLRIAREDGRQCVVSIPVDSGAAGKQVALQRKAKLLKCGSKTVLQKTSNSKINRAIPFIQAVQEGRVHVVRGVFEDDQWRELELFDGSRSTRSRKDDVPDSCADLVNTFLDKLVIQSNVKIGSDPSARQRLRRLGGKTLL